MAWEDVPGKLDQYDTLEYAPDGMSDNPTLLPSERLIRQYNGGVSNDIADVPEVKRGEFEERLDYLIGACVNLAKSRAIRPEKLQG